MVSLLKHLQCLLYVRHYGRCGRNKAIKKKRDENMPKKKKRNKKKKKKKKCASKTRNMPRGDGKCKKMRQKGN